MLFHTLLRSAALFLCATAAAADRPGLPSKEAAEGWVQLFDGETAFGWDLPDGAKLEGRAIKIPAGKPAKFSPHVHFGVPTDVFVEYEGSVNFFTGTSRVERIKSTFGIRQTEKFQLTINSDGTFTVESSGSGRTDHTVTPRAELAKTAILFETDGKADFYLHAVKVRPLGLKPLFNGKDLAGWKKFTGNPKQEKSEFGVTPAGELFIKNGPGDLQTEKQFADFVLQLECKTNGPSLNSGVFFRGLPGQYQQGYEAQIQNAVLNGDRSKPIDYGTGAIYRRIAARKVAADDKEWFTLSVLAKGDRIATWVNGYPAVNWKDERKAAENARQGLRTAAGVISLQGHDPTTDLLFRNIRIVEFK